MNWRVLDGKEYATYFEYSDHIALHFDTKEMAKRCRHELTEALRQHGYSPGDYEIVKEAA
jgi:hypothetical protein